MHLPSDLSTEHLTIPCRLLKAAQTSSLLKASVHWPHAPQKTAFLRATSHVSSHGTGEVSEVRKVPGTRERWVLSETWGRAWETDEERRAHGTHGELGDSAMHSCLPVHRSAHSEQPGRLIQQEQEALERYRAQSPPDNGHRCDSPQTPQHI